MPNYNKHLIGGLLAFIPTALFFGTINTTESTKYTQWLFFCLVGSLFPDIDTKSHIQKWFYTLAFLTICFLYLSGYKISIAWTLLVIPLIVRHRGLFHSPRFLLLLSIALVVVTQLKGLQSYYDFWTSSLFFLIGAYSHLILDLGYKRFLIKLFKNC